jgi:glycerate-2-kinase
VQKYGVEAPAAGLKRLREGAAGRIEDTPKPGDPIFSRVDNFIIANNTLLVDAAMHKAIELGFRTIILASEVEGEAKDVGGLFAAVAHETAQRGNPIEPPACILAAGETTVTVRGKGKGGRNQEMTLAWALAMSDRALPSPCCFASVASDGTDGPTDAAGGLVDPGTCGRAAGVGMNAAEILRSNDSYALLKATGDLIVTGPTYTNLMDVQILLVG